MMFFKRKDKQSIYSLILVGLGNPGSEYEHTRHNAGFDVIDAFCEKHSVTLNKNKFNGLFGDAIVQGKRLLVLKPQTFMNLSGQSVAAVMKFYKRPTDALLVVSDDISLPVGKMRIRKNGSAGGQKGLKSIIEHLGTDQFARMKMGVDDRPDKNSDLANWVLGRMSDEERNLFDKARDNAVKAIETFLRDGADAAMNRYNH